MAHKKMHFLPVLLLPIILILIFELWSSSIFPVPWIAVESDTGVFDMRDIDFDSEIAALTRIVEYIPDEFLTPEEFELRDDIQVGKVPYEARVCTMRVRILVPDERMYGLGGYSVNYASSVFINGKWLFDEGKPALTPETEESTESYRLFSAAPQDGVIEIVIQTSAFANIDTSTSMGWYIGDYELSRIFFTRKISVDIMVIAIYATLAVISLLLYFVLPSYKANGWLALLAATHAVRTGLKSTKILLTLLPYFDWPFVYIAEKLTDSLTIILLTLILHSTFPKALPKWLRFILIGGSAIGMLLFLLLPWQTFLGTSGLLNQIVFTVLGVLFVFILVSLRHTRPTLSQTIILIGIGLALYAFLHDADYFGHWQLISFSFSITQPMFIVFTMFMLVATMLDTMRKTVEQEVHLAREIEAQKLELTDARISTMLSQIQPHFLYNSLSTIGDLCYTDADKAHEAVVAFADYLRANMDSLSQKELIPFEQELEHTRQYLWLEHLRFEERLRVESDIQAEGFLLPVLTLQPIVENAVRYGITRKKGGGAVRIQSAESVDGYTITVSDTGVGFDIEAPLQDDRSHMGIANVRARLAAMCNGQLTVTSNPGEGTTVIITIPKGKEVAKR